MCPATIWAKRNCVSMLHIRKPLVLCVVVLLSTRILSAVEERPGWHVQDAEIRIPVTAAVRLGAIGHWYAAL